MTDSTPSDLGREIQGLITRAIEGRILPEEAQSLRLSIEALTNDRREPVGEEQLAQALQFADEGLTSEVAAEMAGYLLQVAVVTKLPHPVWARIEPHTQ